MKNRVANLLVAPALLALAILICQPSTAFAQGTAFTYQGQLQNNGSLANGSYDLQFALFDAATSGSQVGGNVTNPAVGVTNGLFTTTIDFGPGIFTGDALWLQIGVETNGGGGNFTLLGALQPLTPTPYAIYSENSGAASSVIASSVFAGSLNTPIGPASGQVLAYNGSGLVWSNVASAGGGGSWSLTGNAGTTAGVNYLGTSDNQPLELHVNGTLAFRLVPGYSGDPNVVGGWQNNVGSYPDAVTIAGGYGNSASGNAATVGGGYANTANGTYATLGGGIGNYANGMYATTGGGQDNSAAGEHSAVGGGSDNEANSEYSTVAGGYQNIEYGSGAFIGGGGYDGTTFAGNSAYGAAATVAGGLGNSAGNTYATVGGGASNNASGLGAFVGGGGYNDFGASGNTAYGTASTVAGGSGNTASGYGTVGGGDNNTSFQYATVGGGGNNTSSGEYATVGGGAQNMAIGTLATIPGGYQNAARGYASFAAGQSASANDNNSFLWGDGSRAAVSQGSNSFAVLATGGVFFYTTPSSVNVEVDTNADLDFGTTTRQMLNLYSSTYGIGVQSNDEYFRTADEFFWFVGGTHNNGNGNAGGGTQLMELDSSGNLSTKGTITANSVLLTSDRNAKENFAPVDARVVLAKVASLPVTEWNYKTDTKGVQHIGPMAQDFQAAFGMNGGDEKHISVVDEGGVALAAIQGLNQKLNDKEAEIKQLKEKADRVDALEEQNDLLAARLNKLEAAVNMLAKRN